MVRKLVALSLLIALFVPSFPVLLRAAVDGPASYFYPEHKWVVAPVQSKGAPSCVLSNQLNNGYVVQLVGTSERFSNLNIDFRQDVFKESNSYDVGYSVPGALEKTISAKASEKNFLITDLRSEFAISDALRTSNVLDVDIEDTQFRIYLTGLGAALSDYDACVGSRNDSVSDDTVKSVVQISDQVGVSGGGAAMVPPPPVHQAPGSGRAVVDLSEDAAVKSLKKTGYIQQMAQKLKGESLKYQPDSVRDQDVPEVQQNSVSLPPEGDDLDFVVSDVSSVEQVSTRSDITNVPVQRAISSKPVYNVTKMDPVSVDLTGEDLQVRQDLEIARSDISQSTAESLAAIEPAYGGDSNSSADRSIVSEKKIAALTQKNAALEEELKAVLQDRAQEQFSVSSRNWNLEKATMKFNEAERQIMRLGRQLQTQKAQCVKEKASLETMLFDPELTNEQQLAALASLEADLDRERSDFRRKEDQYRERIRLLEERLGAR